MSRVHDMGGQTGFGPVPVNDDGTRAFEADWEARVYALAAVLRQRGLFNSDELRDAIERLPPAEYLGASYYERWLGAIETLVAEKGLIPREGFRVSYAAGERVRARPADPGHHTRVPRYVRGHLGVVVAFLGDWPLPDASAGGVTRPEPCYAVRFEAADLFGGGDHTVTVDLWESYLERA